MRLLGQEHNSIRILTSVSDINKYINNLEESNNDNFRSGT